MKGLPLALLAWLSGSASAASLDSGASFLKIGSGARPAAMGEAYTALADDVNALYYNPGGLAGLAKRELGATHAEWLLGSRFDFFGYAQPTGLGTFAVALTRLDNGGMEARGADRRAAGSFGATDSAYTLGFGRSVEAGAGRTQVGASAKWLESRIGADSAATLAFDLGAVHRLGGQPLSVGLSVLNLGRGLRFIDQTDPLPLTLSAGAAYRLGGALQLALDVRHEPNDRRTDIGLGTEYALLPSLALRAGYGSGALAGSGGSLLGGLGAGFGIKLSNYRADYTFTPFGALGNAQKLSVGARF
ncbi:MAG: PorV/PorQ family protein [Elusimicrobia bacterium]|nr:PorV/PorQ family protein [Elusimicrobiota bacterium]